MFILLIFCFIDTYKFISKLYTRKIMTTHHERNINMRINRYKADNNSNIGDKSKLNDAFRSRSVTMNRITNNSTSINPVKQGLSEDTLKILIGVFGVILRQLHCYIDDNRLPKNKNYYIATSKIVKTISSNLLVFEQINAILLGPNYVKNSSYLSSKQYEAFLNEMEMFDMMNYNNTSLESFKYYKNIKDLRKKTKVNEDKTSSKGEDVPFTREKFDKYMRNYLLNSDENWILMQYNLCKAFLIQNSIMKPKSVAVDLNVDNIDNMNSLTINNQRSMNPINKTIFSEAGENKEEMIKVIDISALFRIIKEIEKRVKIRTEHGDLISANELYRCDESLL